MKALWKSVDGLLEMREIEEPMVVLPDDIKIKVSYSTIGHEDLRMFREGDFFAKASVAGYEMSGVIVDLGEHAANEGFYVGQRVAGTPIYFCGSCYFCKRHKAACCANMQVRAGTLCEYVVWSSRQVVPLPAQVSAKVGALLEEVAVALEGCERMRLGIGDSICIFGADFLGLVLVQLAQIFGVETITVVEPQRVKRVRALALGANNVVDPTAKGMESELLSYTDFNGFDAIAITSGDVSYMNKAVDLIAKQGVLLLMTYYEMGQKLSLDVLNFSFRQMIATSSFLYNTDKLELAGKLLHKLRLEELIGAEYPFEQVCQAFEELKTGAYPRIAIKL